MLEAALILPIFLFLLVSIVEVGLMRYAIITLHGTSTMAARYSALFPDVANKSPLIRNYINRTASSILVPSKIQWNSRTYPTAAARRGSETCLQYAGSVCVRFNDVNGNGRWDDAGRGGVGSAGEFEVFTFTYDWQFYTPFVKALTGSGSSGRYEIKAIALVYNE